MSKRPPRLELKDGTPSVYGFACGYGLLREKHPASRVSLFREHGTYDVKSINWNARTPAAAEWASLHGWNDPYGFRTWDCFESVETARKVFYEKCKLLGV